MSTLFGWYVWLLTEHKEDKHETIKKVAAVIAIVAVMMFVTPAAQADLVLNPATGEYIVVRDADNYELRLNPSVDNAYDRYSVEEKDSDLELNPYTIEYDYD